MKITKFVLIGVLIFAGCGNPQPSHSPIPINHENIACQNFIELVTNDIVRYITDKAGLSVVRISKNQIELVKILIAKKNADGFVVIKVKNLEVVSAKDSYVANLTLELVVFDKTGIKIYEHAAISHYEIRTGNLDSRNQERIAGAVVKDALKQLVKDPELKKIMA